MPEEGESQAQRPASVALIRPSRPSEQVTELIRTAENALKQQGLPSRSYRTRRVRLPQEVAERRETELLDGNDAHRIYATSHEADTLVLAFAEAYVRRDPSNTPSTRKAALPLDTFVAHKALFRRVRGRSDIEKALAAFTAWRIAPPGCSSFDDPRVLPLHVFEVSGDWSRLGEPEVDAEFARIYGKVANRRDEGGRDWARASALHGRDLLTIARRRLDQGAHWDVTTQRRSATLRTSYQVWHMRFRPRDYLNVYPNEYVRKTSGSGCKLVFPKP